MRLAFIFWIVVSKDSALAAADILVIEAVVMVELTFTLIIAIVFVVVAIFDCRMFLEKKNRGDSDALVEVHFGDLDCKLKTREWARHTVAHEPLLKIIRGLRTRICASLEGVIDCIDYYYQKLTPY